MFGNVDPTFFQKILDDWMALGNFWTEPLLVKEAMKEIERVRGGEEEKRCYEKWVGESTL